MTFDEFKNVMMSQHFECEVKDDIGHKEIIEYWFEPLEVEDNCIKKVTVCTDWAVSFNFNILDNDTPKSLRDMAVSCIKDAYCDVFDI